MSSESKYINAQYQGFFEDSLSKTDPELFKAIKNELNRQQESYRTYSFRKYCFSSGIRGSRFSFNQQVCRRLSRKKIL